MADKGEYRGIYVALLDSWEYQELSACARACLTTLKLKLGQAGIDVFAHETLPRYTGFSAGECEAALEELMASDWLRVERNVYWIRNGLRYEPTEPLRSPNGRKGIRNHLRSLPSLAIVQEFTRYYEIGADNPSDAPAAFETSPSEAPPEEHTIPLRSTEDGRRKTEEKTDLSDPAAPKSDPVREVFEYWQARSGHTTATLTPDRKAKIKARLKRYTVDQLRKTVDAAAESAFHQGDNDRQTRYDWPETIFKTDASTERLMLNGKAPQTPVIRASI